MERKYGQLKEELGGKSDQQAADAFKVWVETRLKHMDNRMRAAEQADDDTLSSREDAAGLKRQFYHCISCDRPLGIKE